MFTISGLGVNANVNNFLVLSKKKNGTPPDEGEVYFVGHVAGYTNDGGSQFVGADTLIPTPEPASLLFACVGFGGLGLVRLVRRLARRIPRPESATNFLADGDRRCDSCE